MIKEESFLRHIVENVEYCDTHIGINKEELFKLCEEKNIPIPPRKIVKKDLIDYLVSQGVSWSEFYVRWKHCTFGIHPSMIEKKFNINKTQRKKMEQLGFLKVAYKINTKVFTNTYADVPYYDAEQYFLLTLDEVEAWKIKNIRGYRKRKAAEME